ncbi:MULTISPECIES: HAMP domain-containing sensor histidine kinase [unclassified Pseudodesulfovibrio]|uniref:sensor histidine kinase n=1 Tax=unclassified Pseudodesulfovibrio TaxID=2661612 RepID=UPI000FEBAC63|nr:MULTISPECIES: HAMP domain-containing sensor histidine kinase [unclassified Pseudodesulfovibrio]MCJ2165129.1 HAMP domain-containing histidine kinase [Pseudodesulfovibrio sp. S3-i]RWU03414.1 sensor histidine kinase [Pseudodesulfovibrio sp. S3]
MDRYWKEIMLYVGVLGTGYLLFAQTDAFEWYYAFSRAHESFELDELALIVPVILLCLVVFAVLRLRDLRRKTCDLNRVHDELIQANSSLEELAKSKEEFMDVACHELKSPLSGIVGALQLMDLSETEAERRESAELAMNAARNLSVLIDDVREFNRISRDRSVTMKAFSLPGFAEFVRHVAQTQTDAKQLELQVVVENDIPEHILGSESALRLIVLNLVGNAVKFTQHGGISVHFSFQKAERTELTVTVTDTGIGIPKADHERIFEAYTKVDNASGARGGLGLGLAIVKRLVDQLGGEITVSSEEGQGSLFRVSVPMSPA